MSYIMSKCKRVISIILSFAIVISCLFETEIPVYAQENNSSAVLANSAHSGLREIYNGHLYSLIETPMTWTEAKEYCESLGGHLITITDESENVFFINNLFSKTEKTLCWLGGYYDESARQWKWVTGEKFAFTNWDNYMPDHQVNGAESENYLMTYKNANPGVRGSQGYKWNDIYENGVYPGEESFFAPNQYCFVCEWDSISVENPIQNKLDYTIFSGSSTADLNLYGWKSNFTGDVYTGRNFNYGGSEFYVDGRIDAVGTITTNGWKTEITERCENVEKVDMPDLDASIHEMAAPFESFEESPTYIQDRNIIDSSIKVNGDVVISGTTFEGDCYIIAEGNITYNVVHSVHALSEIVQRVKADVAFLQH